MPVVTEAPVRAYCHCRNARCPGYQQEEVAAVREETGFTYRELNGNKGAPDPYDGLMERSTVRFRFEDESEAPCPVCGEAREVTGEPRPSYQPLSGHDPMGLLQFGGFDAGMAVPADDRTAALEAQLAAVQAQMQALIDAQAKE